MSGAGSRSSGFLVDYEKLALRIKILPLGELKPHEETIPSELERLTRAIQKDLVVRNPIIVDERTGVVLDGMHRLAALHRLETRGAPVCTVDYQSPEVRLGRWFRLISAANHPLVHETAKEVLGERFDRQPAGSEGFEDGVLISDGTKISSKQGDRLERLHAFSKLEMRLRGQGARVTYDVERQAVRRFESGHASALIAFPILNKEDVLKAALGAHLLPHKTTRHVVPARPMHTNTPLSMLRDRTLSEDEANQSLVKQLNKRTIKRLAPGSKVDDRTYEEEIFLFSEN